MIIKPDSAILATAVVIIFISAITIAADLYSPLKDWLKETFSHHWIGKGIIASVLWMAIAVLPVRKEISQKIFMLILIFSTVAIALFYILHFLKVL